MSYLYNEEKIPETWKLSQESLGSCGFKYIYFLFSEILRFNVRETIPVIKADRRGKTKVKRSIIH